MGAQSPRVVAMLDLLSRWVSCRATKNVKGFVYFTTVCGWLYVRTLIGQPLMSDACVTFRGHLCSVSNVMKSWRRLPIGESVTAEPKLERDLMFNSRQVCTYQGVKQS